MGQYGPHNPLRYLGPWVFNSSMTDVDEDAAASVCLYKSATIIRRASQVQNLFCLPPMRACSAVLALLTE